MESFTPFGRRLPAMVTPPPGPASRALTERLRRVESQNITGAPGAGPIFWTEARGANVRDADGNVYVDLTAGFGVAAAGHALPAAARAMARQARTLPHALGDVYPAPAKLELLERLAAIAPGRLGVGILASAGAEAVEAALKTALLRTGRPGVLAFTGSYHGLTYGALAVTGRAEFREPFQRQLYAGVRFAPYPDPYHWQGVGDVAASALATVRRILDEAESTPDPIGAILVEPVQGRGGIVVPPAGFLRGLRALCDGERRVLIFDEIYTGFGRTGRWFAWEHEDVVPDLLVLGKALSGALPLSVVLGSPEVMAAWPPSAGEALHTSTFLGNPIACAAALAQIEAIERGRLVERADRLGRWLARRLGRWRQTLPCVGDVRGRGLMYGVALVEPGSSRPAPGLAARVVEAALSRGVLLLTEGPDASVLAITPPLVITLTQLSFAVDVIEAALRAG